LFELRWDETALSSEEEDEREGEREEEGGRGSTRLGGFKLINKQHCFA
jgi:hypothetical protein